MTLDHVIDWVQIDGQLVRWQRAGGGGQTLAVPGVPTAVKGTSDSSAQATITWSVPASDGGSPITGYLVARDGSSSSGGGPWSTTVAADQRSLRFLSLIPSTTYHLTVAAINAQGTGPTATVQITTLAAPPPGDPGERFPGDPNAKQSGKFYWGQNPSNLAANEKAAGAVVGVQRHYWTEAQSPAAIVPPNGGLYQAVRADHAADRLPLVSFKLPLSEVAAGSHDSQLDALIAELQSYDKPTAVILWHEPENDPITAATYSAAQKHFRSRLTAYAMAHPTVTNRIMFCACYIADTFRVNGPRNPVDWVPLNTFDVVLADIYAWTSGQQIENPTMTAFIAFVEARGIPFGFGEWGIQKTDSAGGAKMLKFYDDMINGSHDIVSITYFNNAQWVMTDENGMLSQFRELITDPRSVHLSDLGY